MEEKMQSVVSYIDRGMYGKADYRGNCSGYVIKDLISIFIHIQNLKSLLRFFLEEERDKM